MGLLGNLFSKKECAICGGEIGLLGNRKLEDGNLCKHCAAKLSPFFSERRHSTVDEIAEQLRYREENQERVAAFQKTRTIGRNTKLILDEVNHKFMVTSASNIEDANPDVLDFADVTGCDIDIDEDKTKIEPEKKQEPEPQPAGPAGRPGGVPAGRPGGMQAGPAGGPAGRQAGPAGRPNPAAGPAGRQAGPAGRPESLTGRTGGPAAMGHSNPQMQGMPQGRPGMAPMQQAAPRQEPVKYNYRFEINMIIHVNNPYFDEIRFQVSPGGIYVNDCIETMHGLSPDPYQNSDYIQYLNMANEMKEALTGIREQVYAENAAAAESTLVTCPWCGSTTSINENGGNCQFCGGALN